VSESSALSMVFCTWRNSASPSITNGGGFLRHVGNGGIRWQGEIAGVGFQRAAQQRKQAGFATAIGACHAHPLTGVNDAVDVFQQGAGAAPERQLIKLQHSGQARQALALP